MRPLSIHPHDPALFAPLIAVFILIFGRTAMMPHSFVATRLWIALPLVLLLYDVHAASGNEAIDPTELDSPSLWEELTLPVRPDYMRARVLRRDDEAHPHHLLRFRVTSGPGTVDVLLHRDRGERDALDLMRASLTRTGETVTWVAGDIAVDRGLGWTVATSPSWASSTTVNAPLRADNDRLRANRSSEEGFGWIGVAVKRRSGSSEQAGPSVWSGYRSLDSRFSPDGSQIPYATQGDHRADRESIGWWHLGTSVPFTTPWIHGTVQLIGAINQFTDRISPETSSARFAGIERSMMAAGVAYRNTPAYTTDISLEVTAQRPGGVGGGLTVSHPVRNVQFVGAAWGATTRFISLHSRPYLGFGSTPAGRTGLTMAADVQATDGIRASIGLTEEYRARYSGNDAVQNTRLFGGAWWRVSDTDELHLMVRSTRIRPESGDNDGETSVRGRWSRWTGPVEITLRAESAWTDLAWAGMAGFAVQGRGTWARVHASLTGTSTNGQGAAVSVVEPSAPGLFPVIRVHTEQIRAAARVDLLAGSHVRGWLIGAVEQDRDESSNADPTWTLGLGLEIH